jgi:NTE family protein
MNQRLIRFLIVKMMTLCLFLVNPFLSGAQEKTEKSGRPKIALVLSGGGAKGFAHIGVLKVLEEEGIPIDLIVGTSMGSLVGGIYSLGYNALELEGLVKSLNWEKTLSDEVPRIFLSKNDQLIKQRYIFSLPIDGNKKLSLPQGLVNGQNVLNIFCGLAGNVPTDADFSKFTIPFACVATDLETGKEVVLKDDFLPTAMFSSMAIPIAFKSADRNGFLLADGGLVNNFPTDVAKKMGAEIIIGVDIRSDFYHRDKLNTIENVMGQLVGFFDMGKDSINKSNCDLIIRPDITGYSVSSFNNQAVDTLIIRGENAANGFRKQLRELKTKYKLEKPEKSRELVKPDQWHITKISFTGNYHLDQDYMEKILNLKIPGNFSSEEIKTAIDRLYGLGGFELIYFNLIDTGKGKTLNLNITTKEIFTQNIGFKANTTDAAAILINITRKNYKNVFGLLSASAELSRNPGLTLIAESNRTKLPTLGISLKGKYQNYNVFENGDKIFDAKIFYTSGALYLYKPFLEWFNLGLGLQEEYYQGDIYKKKDIYPIVSTDPNTFLTNAYSYLSFDNMDDFYFPRKGTNIYAEFSLTADFKMNNNLSPAFLFKMRNVVPVWHKTALLFDFYHRALFNPDFPQPKATLVGGEPYSQYFSYHLPFVGLSSVNIADRYTFISLVGLRRQVSDSQYFSVLLNCLKQTNDIALFNDNNMIFGGGIKYGLKTFVGPMDMTLGYSGSTRKPTFSANFGYWF